MIVLLLIRYYSYCYGVNTYKQSDNTFIIIIVYQKLLFFVLRLSKYIVFNIIILCGSQQLD